MKVLVLTPSLPDTSPSMRFRLEQWAPYLERNGFQFHYQAFEDQALHDVMYQPGRLPAKAYQMGRALWRRRRMPALADEHDLIFLHREAAGLGPALLERWLARRGVPLVYDFDDPIWLPYRSPTNGLFSLLKCPGKTASICRLASQVIVGNRLLAEWARQHSRDVHIVPSTIEMGRYPPASRMDRQVITLGWTGSHSTVPFLQMLANPLRQLAGRLRFRVLVIAHTDKLSLDLGPVEVVTRAWRPASEASDLAEMDIGLAPFPDTGWTPWRCHGKVLQYMAAGIPSVASEIGILGDYIRQGQEGFLVRSEAEWVEKLSRLIEDADLRQRMGESARQRVAAEYAADVWAPRVQTILEGAAAGRMLRTMPCGT